MFKVGDRVWIIGGGFKGEKATIHAPMDDDGDYDVLIDGRPLLYYIAAEHLTKVEVTVVEGRCDSTPVLMIDGEPIINTLRPCIGERVRITIERLPKEV